MVVVSTIHLIKIVFSTISPLRSSSVWDTIVSNPDPALFRTRAGDAIHPVLRKRAGSGFETRDTNRGHPLVQEIFISDIGFLKELLIGSGWKVSTMSLPPAWLMSLKVTLCVNGHWRMLSNSPRITTKNSER